MTLFNSHDNIIKNNQVGYYKVGEKLFLNKLEALQYSAQIVTPVTYHWFDEAFDTFDRSLLGTVSLDALYKERAQRLRDKYDYLILNYSGGCDSWNILKTFLDNNIKLDQVMVCWPFGASKTYKPNIKDVSADNFMSEWDFTTKPDLEWLAQHHPDIKIELIDWAEPFINNPNFVNERSFDNLNHFHNLADLARSTLFSETERDMIEKGKTVGTIWGLDKPNISRLGNQIGMSFYDSVTTVAHPAPCNPFGTEYFYWDPNMPILAYEMAFQTLNWFKARPRMQEYIWNASEIGTEIDTFLVKKQVNLIACRDSCYTTWNNKPTQFQVNKPVDIIRADKDFWLYEHSEMSNHVNKWKPLYDELLSTIDRKDTSTKDGKPAGYRSFSTKRHYFATI